MRIFTTRNPTGGVFRRGWWNARARKSSLTKYYCNDRKRSVSPARRLIMADHRRSWLYFLFAPRARRGCVRASVCASLVVHRPSAQHRRPVHGTAERVRCAPLLIWPISRGTIYTLYSIYLLFSFFFFHYFFLSLGILLLPRVPFGRIVFSAHVDSTAHPV